MKTLACRILVGLFIVVGLVLLALTNLGLISFRAPYIESLELHSANQAIVFMSVNVVPMDRERVLQNQTVIVRNGVIEKIGERVDAPTDASNPYHILGFSAHEELAAMVDAGLTPYEALAAGTRNAAEALGKSSEFGTVAEGKRADLILLSANPLGDVANANKRVGVMLRGKWLPEQELQTRLNGLAESYAPTLLERVLPLVLIAAGLGLALAHQRRAPRLSDFRADEK